MNESPGGTGLKRNRWLWRPSTEPVHAYETPGAVGAALGDGKGRWTKPRVAPWWIVCGD